MSVEPRSEPCADPSLEPQLRQRRAEQAAFAAQLDELLERRLGQWAVFAGGRPAIYAILAFLLEDVEVAVEETEYTPYFDALKLLRRPYHVIPSNPGNRFRPTLAEQSPDGPARFLLKSNPCNPTGVAIRGEELKRLVLAWSGDGRGALFDEAYEFFADPSDSALRHVGDLDAGNVFVVGAATKGGDEVPNGVWQRSPAAQEFMKQKGLKSVDELWFVFYGRVEQILKKHGIPLSGWEEIAVRKTKREGQDVLVPNPMFGRRSRTVWCSAFQPAPSRLGSAPWSSRKSASCQCAFATATTSALSPSESVSFTLAPFWSSTSTA